MNESNVNEKNRAPATALPGRSYSPLHPPQFRRARNAQFGLRAGSWRLAGPKNRTLRAALWAVEREESQAHVDDFISSMHQPDRKRKRLNSSHVSESRM